MQHHFVQYNSKLKPLARQLRKSSTLAEILLWNELKRKKMMGFDFHRQKPIDRYILDFYCPVLRLVIEIDGDSHFGRQLQDQRRQRELEALGLRFLRFDDFLVKRDMEGVLKTIRKWIEENTGDTPPRLKSVPL
jgi:very-short-patch-repair endonuclease